MSDEGFVDRPPPSGFRVYRGAELVSERKCVLCPSRICECLLEAFDDARKTVAMRGGAVVVETIEGVALTTRSSTRSGSTTVRRTGPSKPPRRAARPETIPPPAPAESQTTTTTEDHEDVVDDDEEQIA